MKLFNTFVTLSIALAALGGAADIQPSGSKFKLRGSDGKSYSAAGSVPTILVFFEAGCPHNAHGMVDMNHLSHQLKGKFRLLGITDQSERVAKKFARKYHSAFPILADPGGKTIHALGAEASLDTELLAPGGKILHKWMGYSRSTLGQLFKLAGERTGTRLSPDLGGFPRDRQSGCAFMLDMH